MLQASDDILDVWSNRQNMYMPPVCRNKSSTFVTSSL